MTQGPDIGPWLPGAPTTDQLLKNNPAGLGEPIKLDPAFGRVQTARDTGPGTGSGPDTLLSQHLDSFLYR